MNNRTANVLKDPMYEEVNLKINCEAKPSILNEYTQKTKDTKTIVIAMRIMRKARFIDTIYPPDDALWLLFSYPSLL
jgi:hypothetical protein